MAVRDPDQIVEIAFVVDGEEFCAAVRRGQIIHEAFHAALPLHLVSGRKLQFSTESGRELFADLFIGDLVDQLGTTRIVTSSTEIEQRAGEWRNIGIDHLAITVEDRAGARDFFRDVLHMQIVRDDQHLTVATTGMSALMFFDASQEAPLSDGRPSSWHHIGFVVDDLAAAYAHLQYHRDQIISEFAMLERNERWSLYFFYRNGSVTFLIQLSEVKNAERGITAIERSDFSTYLYDYASQPYYGLDILEVIATKSEET